MKLRCWCAFLIAITVGCSQQSQPRPVEPVAALPAHTDEAPAIAPATALEEKAEPAQSVQPAERVEPEQIAGPIIVPDYRTWSDSKGGHKVKAALIEAHNGTVYLRRDNGHILSIARSKLRSADRDYVDKARAPPHVIEGRIISVADGDTITILDGNKPVRIRLEGIDAPELRQAFGMSARHALSDKVVGKVVRVEWRSQDKYGRYLGDVFVDGEWVNRELVREGYAWHYKEYSKSPLLAEAEVGAKSKSTGLWSHTDQIEPWVFRHSEANVKPPTVVAKPPPRPAPKRETKPAPVDRNEDVTIHTGPRGGRYHYSKNGNKVYERKRK